jgi:tetratricopeptide (TPR) repeat protein
MSTVGCALCDAGELDRGLPILERSLELDPNNAHAWTAIGAAMMMKKDFQAAVDALTKGIAMSPSDSRLSVWGAVLAMAKLVNDDSDGALAAARQAKMRDDRNYLPRLAEAAVLASQQETGLLSDAVRETLRTRANLEWDEVRCFVGSRLADIVWSEVERQRGS